LHLFAIHIKMNEELTKNLRSGDRCFYFTKNKNNQTKMFRANFIEIIKNRTLVVTQYADLGCQIDKSFRYSMPLNWITRAMTLDNIIGDNNKLPCEIMRIIDSYLL
jgi:hypothetical protein